MASKRFLSKGIMEVTINDFKQTSSIINRLKAVMIIIAVFIIFCSLVVYLTSFNTLQEIQNLKEVNDLLNSNSNITETLNTIEDNLNKITSTKNVHELLYVQEENQKLLLQFFETSLELAEDKPDLTNLLSSARENIVRVDAYRKATIHNLLKRLPIEHGQVESELDEMADILVAKQLVMDTKDLIRKIQILVKKESDGKFFIIYQDRFKPLVAAVSVSILFFLFVATFGWSISRRIGKSISTLLNATDLVSSGNLNHHVTILHQDEIGRLSDAFNQMVDSLKTSKDSLNQSMDRTHRLQAITASFSEALLPEQVYEIIFKHAFEALDAVTAAIAFISADKNYLELKRVEGSDAKELFKWQRMLIKSEIPLAKVVSLREPIFIEGQNSSLAARSIASLPLVIGNEAFGSICFCFPLKKKFDPAEKDFMMALARQCAQAIYRSNLYDNANKAIEARALMPSR